MEGSKNVTPVPERLVCGPETALEAIQAESTPKEFGSVWVCSRYGPRDPRSNQAPGPILEPT